MATLLFEFMMTKREHKKQNILDAAESIIRSTGFEKSKMEDIAQEAGISKGSVYFYFESKENLYLALIFRAMNKLVDTLYSALESSRSQNRFDAIIFMTGVYLDFAVHSTFYFELIQQYTKFIRHRSITTSMPLFLQSAKESVYFRKISDIHNIPLKLFAEEIRKGQKEGSIKSNSDPALLFMSIWATVSGYSELKHLVISEEKSTIYNVSVSEWRKKIIQIVEHLLLN